MGAHGRGRPLLAACSVVLSALIGVATNVVTQSRTITLIVAIGGLVVVAALVAWLDGRAAPSRAAYVGYRPPDRAWAEWIRAELTTAAIDTVLREIGPDQVDGPAAGTIVITGRLPLSDGRPLERRAEPARERLFVQVGEPVRPGVPGSRTVSLTGRTEDDARSGLLAEVRALEGVTPHEPRSAGLDHRAPFPVRPPRVWNVPVRNPHFVGRDAVIAALHERLAAGSTVVIPEALYGLGGVGKSQTAIEYAYRHAADYDLVWWIPAEQPAQIRESIAALAPHLGVPVGEGTATTVNAVLDALRRGQPYARWLLIYDNAEDPAQTRALMPAGTGRLLITSRHRAWARYAGAIELGVFDRGESLALLRLRVPTLVDAEAGAVAGVLGDLPLAIEQAGAWLSSTAMPVPQYLGLLDTAPVRLLEEAAPAPADYGRAVPAAWSVALDRLQARHPAAAVLLELCACLAPEPVAVPLLLGSERVLEALDRADPGAGDPIARSRLVREVADSALARLDPAARTLQIHRVVRAVIQHRMTPERLAGHRRLVRGALADADPGDPDDPAGWPVYASIVPHLAACEATRDGADDVRQLIGDCVRWLSRSGDQQGAGELAEQALREWSRYGEHDALTLGLRFQYANALRSQTRYADALAIDRDLYDRQAARHGADDRRTLDMAIALAADLRIQGEYQAAHDLDANAFAQYRATEGEDHVRTLYIANNLACDLRLLGRFEAAAERYADVGARLRRVLGARHMQTLLVVFSEGLVLQCLGELDAARERLEGGLTELRQVFGPDHHFTLLAASYLATTLRHLGRYESAYRLGTDTFERCGRVLARDHLFAVHCLTNVACAASMLGRHDRAVADGLEAVARAESTLGPQHQFTLACAGNVAIFRHRQGRHEDARRQTESVARQLGQRLGDDHPLTIAADVNVAGCLATAGEHRRALEVDASAYSRFRALFGDDHPHTCVAGGNLAIGRRRAGDRRGAAELSALVAQAGRRRLGAAHPIVAALGRRRQAIELEPQVP